MKITAERLTRMLEPGTAIVRAEYRCRCESKGAAPCIRAATEEDGVCDGCRDGADPVSVLWVADVEVRRFAGLVDHMPPRHVSLIR
jgi:hypothetical protein